MSRRYKARAGLHKLGNHSRVRDYQTRLSAIFDAWLARTEVSGYSIATLTTALQQAAEEDFGQAFASGRYQAYPKRRPTADGQEVLTAKLLMNQHYLEHSLAPDIEHRITKWKVEKQPKTLTQGLRDSFASRIRDLYGGAIWTVTEAGYRAGAAQARADLAIRLTGHLHAEEALIPEVGDAELAQALGMSIRDLLALLVLGRSRLDFTPDGEGTQLVPFPGVMERAEIRVGTQYNAEDDRETCDPCIANAQGGEDGDGVYWNDQPPLPGEDCEGFSSCRCSLSTVVDEGALIAA